ncbi:MAG: 5'/3'-nucleotidase SurE [Bacilli bacterium]|nr:5'/3'-nucleotidase SurE [Bacilli bacterium]MDD7315148.1 5'/3'-nucleotidase SurE [Bacilli bacterium]MDY4052684.1 5'/3'-nucleotidase SurE [Bacilli bacterium]
MKVLVTNDDGVKAEGIKILVEKIKQYEKDVFVVAPMYEQSASSHRLTLRRGMNCERIDDIIDGVPTYALDGTPADCVLFALRELDINFDIVFSGINKGYNLGDDIIYSGTFAAAQEALMRDKKAIAMSCKYNSFEGTKYFDEVYKYIKENDLLNERVVLNVNFPANAKGIKITHQAKSTYKTYYIKKEDNLYYTMCDTTTPLNDEPNGDIQAIKNGYISISPLGINYTNLEVYNKKTNI